MCWCGGLHGIALSGKKRDKDGEGPQPLSWGRLEGHPELHIEVSWGSIRRRRQPFGNSSKESSVIRVRIEPRGKQIEMVENVRSLKSHDSVDAIVNLETLLQGGIGQNHRLHTQIACICWQGLLVG
jgi:hypothetical protein